MNEVTYPPAEVLAKQVTEFVEIDGHRVPKHIYMMHMSRKQKRQFEAELRKKNSHIKIVRVENNITTEDNVDIAEEVAEVTPVEEIINAPEETVNTGVVSA